MKTTQRGFTLLIAIIFMSVMLSFGLALGSLAYKQQVLASSALESQYAFYAADAALECALYADQQQNLFAYNPDDQAPAPSMVCDGASPLSATVLSHTEDQWIISERLSFDNGTRCADVTVYKPASEGTNYVFSQGYDVSCAVVADPEGARFHSRGINIRYTSLAPPPPPPPPSECSATGGTVTQSGGYTVHTFTGSGTFALSSDCSVEYLVVGGGGGGGSSGANYAGGGGAGGMLTGSASVSISNYAITVGSGGAAQTNGQNSSAFGFTAIGGGAGASAYATAGANGGSGGGGGPINGLGGTGVAGQGNNGGVASSANQGGSDSGAGGGGGAGGLGHNFTYPGAFRNDAGPGGVGLQNSLQTGSPQWYAAGGSGAGYYVGASMNGIGGSTPGMRYPGEGGGYSPGESQHAVANTGSGGGGGRNSPGGGGGVSKANGGNGGSGIVIIRYLAE